MDWLANHELTELLRHSVIVLNDSDGHADKRTRSILINQFSGHGQAVIDVPYDRHRVARCLLSRSVRPRGLSYTPV